MSSLRVSRNRYINTGFWEDEYILKLNVLEKYLFFYFLTNSQTNLAGIYKISLSKVEFETKIQLVEIEKILKEFCEAGKIFYKNEFIIIKNFIRHQSLDKDMVIYIKQIISQLPNEIRIEFEKIIPEDIKIKLETLDKTFFNFSIKSNKSEFDKSNNKFKGFDIPKIFNETFGREIRTAEQELLEKLIEKQNLTSDEFKDLMKEACVRGFYKVRTFVDAVKDKQIKERKKDEEIEEINLVVSNNLYE